MDIVPDACSLAYWAADIPTEYFIDTPSDDHYLPPDLRPKSYLDIMTRLPAERVKAVHVLDIVMMEFLGINKKGEILNPQHAGFPFYEARQRFFANCKNVPGGKRDSLTTICDTPHGKKVIQLLASIIETNALCEEFEASTFIPNGKSLYQSLALVKNAHADFRRKAVSNGGEFCIGDYINGLTGPVIYLTDDPGGYKIIGSVVEERKAPTLGVHTVDLFRLLKKDNILRKLGFKPSITPENMFADMLQRTYKAKTGRDDYNAISPSWMGGSYDSERIDAGGLGFER